MINGLEGIPGSGKSYEATVYHVLAALRRGRKVVTNLPLIVEQFTALDPSFAGLIELRRKPREPMGTWDANRMDDEGNGNAFELGPVEPPRIYAGEHGPFVRVKSPSTVFSGVWDYYDTWRSPQGLGCLFVVDECHVSLPRSRTDPQVVEWFKLHRHFNQDVLLMTQNFRHMEGDIADLLAMLVKVRKADILGEPDSYIRKVHAGFRGECISKEIRKYKPEFFPLYKSHTQGNAVAELQADDVKPFAAKWKKFSRAFYAFAVVFAIWAFWPSSSEKPLLAVPASKPEEVQNPTKTVTAAEASQNPIADGEMPEPFQGKALHITGVISMGSKVVRTFAISTNAVVIQSVTDADLKAMGYELQTFGDCAASLQWKKSFRAVTCDAPRPVSVASALPDKPSEKPSAPSMTKM
jgi:zona occludens toxin